MLIQSEAQEVSRQTDSIKFDTYETKVLLAAYKNEPNYKRLIDSCESEISEYKAIIKNDSIENQSCESVRETQNLLIASHQDQTLILKDEVKVANRRTAIIGGVGVLEFLLIIYQSIKN